MNLTTAVLLGFANWIATTILVESELTRPVRDWVSGRAVRCEPFFNPPLGVDTMPGMYRPTKVCRTYPKWSKVRYLIGCHLCTGTWVALLEACFVQLGLSHGVVDVVLSALVYKAIGHTVLNINARLASRAA